MNLVISAPNVRAEQVYTLVTVDNQLNATLPNIGALTMMISIEFWGILYYNRNKESPK